MCAVCGICLACVSSHGGVRFNLHDAVYSACSSAYVSSMDSAFGLILRMYVASKIKQPSKDDDLSSPSSFI